MSSTIIHCPGGRVAVIPPIAEKLLARGLIWKEADGYHTADRDQIERAITEVGVCDFCSGQNPTAVFEVGDFMMPDGSTSRGGWAACDTCATLVNQGDKAAVLQRAIVGSGMPSSPITQAAIMTLHDKFWSGRALTSSLTKTSAKTGMHALSVAGVDISIDDADDVRREKLADMSTRLIELPPNVRHEIVTNMERSIDLGTAQRRDLLAAEEAIRARDIDTAQRHVDTCAAREPELKKCQAILLTHRAHVTVSMGDELTLADSFRSLLGELDLLIVLRAAGVSLFLSVLIEKIGPKDFPEQWASLQASIEKARHAADYDVVCDDEHLRAYLRMVLTYQTAGDAGRITQHTPDVTAEDLAKLAQASDLFFSTHIRPGIHLALPTDRATTVDDLLPVNFGLGTHRTTRLTEAVIAEVAGIVGWSTDRLRAVLEQPNDYASFEGETLQQMSGDLGTAIAALENAHQKKSKEVEAVEQQLINCTADVLQAQYKLAKANSVYQSRWDVQIPEGFTEYEFASLMLKCRHTMPTLSTNLLDHMGGTERGVEAVTMLELTGLAKFAIKDADGQPAVFLAPSATFKDDVERELGNRLITYFDDHGDYDPKTGRMRTVGDKIPGDVVVPVAEWVERLPKKVRKVADEANVSVRLVVEALKAMEARGQLTAKRAHDDESGVNIHMMVKDFSTLTRTEKLVAHVLARQFGTFQDGRIKLGHDGDSDMPAPMPETSSGAGGTFIKAVEAQYATLARLSELIHKGHTTGRAVMDGIRIDDLFHADIAFLKRAETFCWFDEPTHAVEAAAASLFDSVHLTRDLTIADCGWWYFMNPLPLQTTAEQDTIAALLWGWTTVEEKSGILFAAYIWDDTAKGFGPSTKCFWAEGTTLAHAIRDAGTSYSALYDDPKVPEKWKHGPMAPLGKERSVGCAEYLMRFFAAGSLWIQQKILVYAKGHVERHSKKRMEQRYDRPLSDIQVIELRRRESVALPATGDSKTVNWKSRWIVGGANGFWRNQLYPSTGKHAPKWIAPFVKGPAHLPLKVPTHRIYSVNR